MSLRAVRKTVRKIIREQQEGQSALEVIPHGTFSSYGSSFHDQNEARRVFKQGIEHYGDRMPSHTVEVKILGAGVMTVEMHGPNAQDELDTLIEKVWDGMYDLDNLAWESDYY
jgi:hypothetical protein